jgi:hypothetical protein
MLRQDRETLAGSAKSTLSTAERVERLISDFSAALRDGVGALFIGSGVSRDAGLPNWSELLSAPAAELGLQLDGYDDLAAVAQYYVNHYCGNRGPLVRTVVDQVAGRRSPSRMHEAISRMNVASIWTTNYDTLLEQAFQGFNVSVRVRDDEVRRTVPSHEIEIVKLHGCVSGAGPNDMVITQEDYEDYFQRRPGISKRFETALQDRTFLFLGYSYRDPNIHSIVTQARRVLAGATRKHYMLQFRENEPARVIRQNLWANDLMRFGIECVLIEGPAQKQNILDQIAEQCRGPTVFVTGGHLAGEHAPSARFAEELGVRLAEYDRVVMLDGQSAGVGHAAVSRFMTRCIDRRVDLEHRLRLFPNPYAADPQFSNDRQLLPMLKKWRAKLMQAASIVIAIDGGMGTRAELDVARERGCRVLPVSFGPGAAREVLNEDSNVTRWLQGLGLDATCLARASEGRATAADVSRIIGRAFRLETRAQQAPSNVRPGNASTPRAVRKPIPPPSASGARKPATLPTRKRPIQRRKIRG